MRHLANAATAALLVALLTLGSCKDDSSGPCGDNVLNTGETCDGSAFGGATCELLGYEGGDLFCSMDCQIIEDACWGCGNGEAERDEECDGDDLRQLTCRSFGFSGGELACTESCTISQDGCTTCGNELIEPGEDCELDDLRGETCETQGFTGGALSCDPKTCQLDTSACEVPSMPTCSLVGTLSATQMGDVTCPDELGEVRWDWYSLPVKASSCVHVQVDNGAGAADLRALVLDPGGAYYYGEADDYSQLDDEIQCSTEPWNGFGCPSASVRVVTSGDLLILVSQVGYLVGGEPGERACLPGLAEYFLHVAVNGMDATTLTLVKDDEPLL